MPKAIIIGATSGIGRAIAERYAALGYDVGITGRRAAVLQELKTVLPGKCEAMRFDVAEIETAKRGLEELIERMGDVDQIIVNAGVGHVNAELDWRLEEECMRTNVVGFAAMCNTAMRYFLARGHGHLAGVSSIAGLRGVGGAPAYSASKAFVQNYLESLRGIAKRRRAAVTVTDIQPGFVDTAMGKNPRAFWKAPADKAARQIVAGMEKKKTRIVVTKRWRLVALALRLLPDAAVDRIG